MSRVSPGQCHGRLETTQAQLETSMGFGAKLKMQERQILFVSHANPEDNEAALWLTTQLVSMGFQVWCDLTDLLGGEKFWDDITVAIEHHTFKFLFISTEASNRKQGTLRELTVAMEVAERNRLRNFVVPLRFDSLAFGESYQCLKDLNFIQFQHNWADGLRELLSLLNRQCAPTSTQAGPDRVSDWYRRTQDTRCRTVVSDEMYYSNWFEFAYPEPLYFHHYNGPPSQLRQSSTEFPFPKRIIGNYLVTFADQRDVEHTFRDLLSFKNAFRVNTSDFVENGYSAANVKMTEARNLVTDLVRQAWEYKMTSLELSFYKLANGLKAWYFAEGKLDKNRAYFRLNGRKKFRQMVGFSTRKSSTTQTSYNEYWHYGLSVSPQLFPAPRLLFRHHVLFTDDGINPWSSDSRMHRARRRVCKNWWNPAWRDRLLAYCSEISGSRETILLPVGSTTNIRVRKFPLKFISPHSYIERLESN